MARIYAEMRTQDAAGQILAGDGTVLHPHYTLVDPATFFALLKIRLEAG